MTRIIRFIEGDDDRFVFDEDHSGMYIVITADGDASLQFVDEETGLAESAGLLPDDYNSMTDEQIIQIAKELFNM